uniref:Uncharacterized protein n=1 Tax=Romanomermis culicivorax TaxID=13658 RepID=A0A915KCI0_ROMCU
MAPATDLSSSEVLTAPDTIVLPAELAPDGIASSKSDVESSSGAIMIVAFLNLGVFVLRFIR